MKTIPTMKSIKILLLTAMIGLAFSSCNMQPPGAETPALAVAGEKTQPVKIMDLIYVETAVEKNITATINPFEETYLSPALQGRIRSVKVEIDDHVKKGQLLFTVKQGLRNLSFNSPVSGKVKEVNKFINDDIKSLDVTTYDKNWICEINADELDIELPKLKIGKSAASFYQGDIERLRELKKKQKKGKETESEPDDVIYSGEMEKMDDTDWKRFSEEFFEKYANVD